MILLLFLEKGVGMGMSKKEGEIHHLSSTYSFPLIILAKYKAVHTIKNCRQYEKEKHINEL